MSTECGAGQTLSLPPWRIQSQGDSTRDPNPPSHIPSWDSLSGPQMLLAVWETTVGRQPSPGRMALPRMEERFTCDLLPTFFPLVKLLVKSKRFFRPYARLHWPESLVSLETKLCPPKRSEKLTVLLTPVCPQGVVLVVHGSSPQRGTSLRNVLVSRISEECRSQVSGACLEYRWCWIWFKMFKY